MVSEPEATRVHKGARSLLRRCRWQSRPKDQKFFRSSEPRPLLPRRPTSAPEPQTARQEHILFVGNAGGWIRSTSFVARLEDRGHAMLRRLDARRPLLRL